MKIGRYKEKYIGERKIKKLYPADDKTFLENERVEIEFKDGSKDQYPEEILEDIVTKKKSDATTLREARVRPVVNELLTILTEAELSLDDVNYSLRKLHWSIENNFEKVLKKVLGKEKKDSSLLDWERVLNPLEQDSDK